jgi:hypothetical protein
MHGFQYKPSASGRGISGFPTAAARSTRRLPPRPCSAAYVEPVDVPSITPRLAHSTDKGNHH